MASESREATSDADLEAWRSVRAVIVGMRGLNERPVYTMRSVSITLRAPLPLAASRGLTSPAVSR
jgi:hypothetical protein